MHLLLFSCHYCSSQKNILSKVAKNLIWVVGPSDPDQVNGSKTIVRLQYPLDQKLISPDLGQWKISIRPSDLHTQ